MPSDSSSARKLTPAALESLSRKLATLRTEFDDEDRPFVDVLLNMLSDPIERMRLLGSTETHFSKEEEEILKRMEQVNRK